MLQRTAKSCGPDAPMLASSSRSRVGPTGLRQDLSADDGGKQARSPGRARRKPLKPLRAGTPGDSGVLVYSRAFYQCKAHARLRVPRASGVPHALCWARDSSTARAHCAARARTCVWNWSDVIVSEATQSIRRHSGAMRSIEPGISRFRVWSCGPSRNDGVWIASRSLSSGAIRATRLLRNDGWLFETRIRLLPQGLVAKA